MLNTRHTSQKLLSVTHKHLKCHPQIPSLSICFCLNPPQLTLQISNCMFVLPDRQSMFVLLFYLLFPQVFWSARLQCVALFDRLSVWQQNRRHRTINWADEQSRCDSTSSSCLWLKLAVCGVWQWWEELGVFCHLSGGLLIASESLHPQQLQNKSEREGGGGLKQKETVREKRRKEREMHVSVPGRREEQTKGQTLESLNSCLPPLLSWLETWMFSITTQKAV